MDRATIVYGVMLLVAAAGVWGVLSIGEKLVAPHDLAGRWTLKSPQSGNPTGPDMTIDQSGKFFQIAFADGPKLNLELDQQTQTDTGTTPSFQMSLKGKPWWLNVKGTEGSDEAEIQLIGPESPAPGVWTAKRILRQFPADVSESSAKGGH